MSLNKANAFYNRRSHVFLRPMVNKLFWGLLSILWIPVHAQTGDYIVKKDLRDEWKVFEDGKYEPWNENEDVSTVYVPIQLTKYQGDFLRIQSEKKFRLFINGDLLRPTSTTEVFSVDSLRELFDETIMMAVHFENIKATRTLLMELISPMKMTEANPRDILRKSNFIRDFAISVSLFLTLFLLIIVRFNPRLAYNYFSIARLLSIRESDDGLVFTKLTGMNILFYIFVSFSLSFFLIIVAQVARDYIILYELAPLSYGTALYMWLKLSAIILSVLIAKNVLTVVLSNLFGLSDGFDLHAFNLLRFFLQASFLLTVLTSLYFIVRGQEIAVYTFLYRVSGFLLLGWIVILYFKLRNRVGCSPFHLFSYLCATEILTLIIISKVLFQ